MNIPSRIPRKAETSRIAVLLATYNGAAFIGEQLQSFVNQTALIQELHVSDDGSTDETLTIVSQWADANPGVSVRYYDGPRQGFAENFRHLLATAETSADYIAFADQDDIWLARKLAVSVSELSRIPANEPAMFCGRTENFPTDKKQDLSPLFSRAPSFANAIVQSIGGGNTMMLNRKAFDIVRESVRRTGFVAHDWWCYQIVSGAGGQVIYWPEPLVKYRQHAGNLIGSNNSWRARLDRLRMLVNDRFREWTDTNLAALSKCQDLLTPDSAALVKALEEGRKSGMVERVRTLWRTGIYRQTAGGQLGLYIAMLFRKL